MLRELWPIMFLMTALAACGRAEFQTTTDSAPAAAPIPSQDDSVRDQEGDDVSERDPDDPDMEPDDEGNGRECQDDLKLPKNCELTSDLRIICKDVVLTSLNRRAVSP